MHCSRDSYSDFSWRIHSAGLRKHIPTDGGIEITSFCNFRCIHCYVRCDDVRGTAERQISLEKYHSIVNQITDAGCLWLQITGGEPLLRKDFVDLYLYTKRKGLLPIIFTNGSLIDENIARLFQEYPPFSIEISLYGASNSTYKTVTGSGENFDKVINGINYLQEYNVPFRLKTPLLQQNLTDLDTLRVIASSYGQQLRIDPIINQNLHASLPLHELRISPEDVIKLDTDDQARREEWLRLYRDHKISEERRSKLFWCNAGKWSFHIDDQCAMSTCVMCRTPSFDLRRGTFLDGWNNLIRMTTGQCRTRESECTSCEDQVLCSQCPGHAMLEHGDREQRIDYFCSITKLRKKHLIMKN